MEKYVVLRRIKVTPDRQNMRSEDRVKEIPLS